MIEIAKELQGWWKQHFYDWNQCRRCPLGERAFLHVLGRGTLPCNVLFVGEGPGKSEDTLGYSFVGPAGRLLQTALDRVPEFSERKLSYFLANLLACRPCDSVQGPNRTPGWSEINACRPRLTDLIGHARPQGIVTLGRLPEAYLPISAPASLSLPHPSWILRIGGQGSEEYLKFVEQLQDFTRYLYEGQTASV